MIEPGTYRHYKGKLYRVLGTALHSETQEPLVVYETLYDNDLSKLWARPAAMFDETVVHEGEKVERFTRLQ